MFDEKVIELRDYVENIQMGAFLQCKFAKKHCRFYFLGKVPKPEDEDGDIEVKFYQNSDKGRNKFLKPSQASIERCHSNLTFAMQCRQN